MKCDYVRIGDAAAIICRSGRRDRRPLKVCCGCRMLSAHLQCDWIKGKSCTPNGSDKAHTCDAWICEGCAVQVGPNKHLCPEHAKAWAEHPKNPAKAGTTNASPEGITS